MVCHCRNWTIRNNSSNVAAILHPNTKLKRWNKVKCLKNDLSSCYCHLKGVKPSLFIKPRDCPCEKRINKPPPIRVTVPDKFCPCWRQSGGGTYRKSSYFDKDGELIDGFSKLKVEKGSKISGEKGIESKNNVFGSKNYRESDFDKNEKSFEKKKKGNEIMGKRLEKIKDGNNLKWDFQKDVRRKQKNSQFDSDEENFSENRKDFEEKKKENNIIRKGLEKIKVANSSKLAFKEDMDRKQRNFSSNKELESTEESFDKNEDRLEKNQNAKKEMQKEFGTLSNKNKLNNGFDKTGQINYELDSEEEDYYEDNQKNSKIFNNNKKYRGFKNLDHQNNSGRNYDKQTQQKYNSDNDEEDYFEDNQKNSKNFNRNKYKSKSFKSQGLSSSSETSLDDNYNQNNPSFGRKLNFDQYNSTLGEDFDDTNFPKKTSNQTKTFNQNYKSQKTNATIPEYETFQSWTHLPSSTRNQKYLDSNQDQDPTEAKMQQISDFRNNHYFETHSVDNLLEESKINHKCVHRFGIDNRFLLDPLNPNPFGQSQCVICGKIMKNPRREQNTEKIGKFPGYYAKGLAPKQIFVGNGDYKIEIVPDQKLKNVKFFNNSKPSYFNTYALKYQRGVK